MNFTGFIVYVVLMALPVYFASVVIRNCARGIYDRILKFISCINLYICLVFFLYGANALASEWFDINTEEWFSALYRGVFVLSLFLFFVMYPYYIILQRKYKDRYVLFNTVLFPAYGFLGCFFYMIFSSSPT